MGCCGNKKQTTSKDEQYKKYMDKILNNYKDKKNAGKRV